jgi:hypothetical protein
MEIEPKTVWAVGKPIITHVSLSFLGDTWEKDLESVLKAETLGVILKHQVEDELYWMGAVHADSHVISDVAIDVNKLDAHDRVRGCEDKLLSVNPEDLLRDTVRKWGDFGSVDFLAQVI